VKPRLGIRKRKGVWPPSKPKRGFRPLRAFCPLCPRPAVFPLPDPIPLPSLVFWCRDPGLSCSVLSARNPPGGTTRGLTTSLDLFLDTSATASVPRAPTAPSDAEVLYAARQNIIEGSGWGLLHSEHILWANHRWVTGCSTSAIATGKHIYLKRWYQTSLASKDFQFDKSSPDIY
jgi:hypothetical protein